MLRIVPATVALAAPGCAQETPDGQSLYMGACAGCHGDEGIGDAGGGALLDCPT